jgi:hypothetical protein
MRSDEEKKKKRSSRRFRWTVGFFMGALILFFQVWWPIQAERSLSQLKRIKSEISEKKSELNTLNAKYAALSSLIVVDEWAKTHGSWKSPRPEDVITLQ